MPFELVGVFCCGVYRKHFFMEDLTKTWSKLSLNEREGSGLTLRNNLRSSGFLLATKFLTRRVLNMEAVGRTFSQLWRSTSGFKIRSLEGHIVLFVFSNPGDITRIIQSEPWCFDKHLVVLEKYDNDVPFQELQFLRASFWVQVHDIPVRFMSKAIAEEICDIIGEICRSIGGVDEDGGSFIRVKVNLDISLPLCRVGWCPRRMEISFR